MMDWRAARIATQVVVLIPAAIGAIVVATLALKDLIGPLAAFVPTFIGLACLFWWVIYRTEKRS